MKIHPLVSLALASALAATMHAQSYKVLVYFNGQPSTPVEPGLIAQSRGGYLLTTATDQSTDLRGVAFRVTTSGTLTILHEFDNATGSLPAGGLTLGTNGRFYGTTVFGGPENSGSIFEMTPNGTVKTLHEFSGNGDSNPYAAPIQGLSGDFYGTTYGSDSYSNNTNWGTIYKVDSSGNYTLLHSFTGDDGANPIGPLVQDATNYWFYGTAEAGGSNHNGTIFRISQRGEFEVLYKFDTYHGQYPIALIQANDGNFYGVAWYGGPYNNSGVVFKMTPTHKVTVLHYFTGGSDGASPLGGFIQATDGYLYGTCAGGGAHGGGVLFRISTTGDFKVLHNFDQATGEGPIALMQHTNGILYGETSGGGFFNGTFYSGVFFRYDLGLHPFVTYLPSYGRVGTTVDILGQGFTAGSQVYFNGVLAQMVTVSPTYMRVVVPVGATSGWITVTTTKGTLKSNRKFLVRP